MIAFCFYPALFTFIPQPFFFFFFSIEVLVSKDHIYFTSSFSVGHNDSSVLPLLYASYLFLFNNPFYYNKMRERMG